jgi:hypothetical protein
MGPLFFFFNSPNPSKRTMALGFIQSLAEMSIRNLHWGKGRLENKAENRIATCEPTV